MREHLGETVCPECGEPHVVCDSLPEVPPTYIDLEDVCRESDFKALVPVFRTNDIGDGFQKTIPVLTGARRGGTETIWYLQDEGLWVTRDRDKDIDFETTYALTLAKVLRQTIRKNPDQTEYNVIVNDDTLPEIQVNLE